MRHLAPALALTFVALGSACSRPAPPPEPVRAVRTITVSQQAAGTSIDYAGEVRARTESRLSFRVAGKMVSRPVDLGDTVKAGQVLASLDPMDLKLGQQAASSGLEAARVNADQANADLKRFKELREPKLELSDDERKALPPPVQRPTPPVEPMGPVRPYPPLEAS